jgi:hypothetical protein
MEQYTYRRADNSRLMSFTVSAWECLCYEIISSAARNERQKKSSKRHVGEGHSVLITAILLPQRMRCCWGKIVPLRMITNFRLRDLRLTTAQQRSTGQNLPIECQLMPLRLGAYIWSSLHSTTEAWFKAKQWMGSSVVNGLEPWYKTVGLYIKNKQTISVAWIRNRTIPTELPPLVGKVSVNFCGLKGVAWSVRRIPYSRIHSMGPTSFQLIPWSRVLVKQQITQSPILKNCMEPGSSLVLSQDPSAGHYSEPHQSSPYCFFLSLWDLS